MADHPTVDHALVAEVARRATELSHCTKGICELTKWIEKYGPRLHPDDIDYGVKRNSAVALNLSRAPIAAGTSVLATA
jgi:hypothetical protein